MRAWIAYLVIATLCLNACRSPAPTAANPSSAEQPTPGLPPVLMLPDYPLSLAASPSTSASVWKQNLDTRIDVLTARSDAQTPTVLAMRASAVFLRFRAYGKGPDLDLAWELASRAAALDAQHVEAQLAYAAIAAYLHEFTQAELALSRIHELDPRRPELPMLRQQIAEALGHTRPDDPVNESLDVRERLLAGAQHCQQMGDLNCASAHFHQLQFLETDSSPLPLAWLHTQQGIALLRFGHPQAAIPFFRAALARLPEYYVAAEHLAECLGLTGAYVESAQLYEQVIANTAHPEYMAGFAGMLSEQGLSDQAEHWRERALRGYEQLLQRYPAAYADHAVGFYLEQGEADLAHRLATENRRLRADVGAELLLAQTAAATGDCKLAAASLAAADATGWRPPERAEVEQLVRGCGKSDPQSG